MSKRMLVFFIFVFVQVPCLVFADEDSKVMVAYYGNWIRYSPSPKRPAYTPSMIDVKGSGITTINYAFIRPYPNAVNILNQTVSPEQAEANAAENIDHLSMQDLKSEEIFRSMMTDPWADVDINKPWDAPQEQVGGSFKELQQLKKDNPGLKTIASFGGWTLSNGFPYATSTADRRTKVATLMVNFVKRYGFDGIDIDWEYPGFKEHAGTPDDKVNFVLFLKELSQQARNNGLLLTLAVGTNPQSLKNGMDLASIHPLVDWMNVMCYDYNGPWGQLYTGHNAPLFNDQKAPGGENPPNANGVFNVEAAVNLYLNAGVPAHKLVLGMPLYGRTFAGVKDNGNGGLYGTGTLTPGTGTVEAGVVSLSDVMQNYLSDGSYQKYTDQTSKVPYLFNASTGDWVSYDDYESLGQKADFVKAKNLRGAMVWSLEAGPEYVEAVKTISGKL